MTLLNFLIKFYVVDYYKSGVSFSTFFLVIVLEFPNYFSKFYFYLYLNILYLM
jgi:hypothetical protein